MPTTRRTRTLAAAPEQLWEVIADPHHLPRWWPGVSRVEGVSDDRFTEVHKTRKGRSVRLDFQVRESAPPSRRVWEQEIAGTPFERVLAASVLVVELQSAGAGTEVAVSQEQKLRGWSRTGGIMLRRATRRRLDEALDGLARISGG